MVEREGKRFYIHWSEFIPKEIYENQECIGFHMTDLPFGRGGSPLQNLLVRGIYNTKITAFRITGELDAGPIYLKRDFNISKGTAREIMDRCYVICLEMIDEILYKELEPIPQEGEVVVWKRINKADVERMYVYAD